MLVFPRVFFFFFETAGLRKTHTKTEKNTHCRYSPIDCYPIWLLNFVAFFFHLLQFETMGFGIGCLYACAPFTLIASILLFMMAVMLRDGNWTFEVLAAKHGWVRSDKSRACRNGGIIYLCVSLVLWCCILLDSVVIHLEKVPSVVLTLWRQRRLPSWRELRRNYRKSGTTHAQPAADVVVTGFSPPTSPPAQQPQPQADTSQTQSAAAAVSGNATSLFPAAAAAAATAQGNKEPLPTSAASPLTAQAHAGPCGSLTPSPTQWGPRAAPPSRSTSATTSVLEADQLLS